MEKRVGVVLGMACALICVVSAQAQVNVTVSQSQMTDGYMSWSVDPYTATAFPGDGGSAASGWGLSAVPAVFSGGGTTVTLSPNVNTYAPGNLYWTNPDGSGANDMSGSTYCEVDGGGLASSEVTFTFNVLSNTLGTDAWGRQYSALAFIKDFGPGYSFNGQVTTPLTVGTDSITYPLTGGNPGEIVQFGFTLNGPDANPATVASLGDVVITAVPEPSTIGLVVCGLLGALVIRRRKA